jgi:hypothetical protein
MAAMLAGNAFAENDNDGWREINAREQAKRAPYQVTDPLLNHARSPGSNWPDGLERYWQDGIGWVIVIQEASHICVGDACLHLATVQPSESTCPSCST